jgi:hypothetical protein
MGVSPARTTNDKLPERPLPVDGNLPSKRSTYCSNKYLKNYENNNYDNNYSNIKDVIFNPSSKLTIYHQNVRGLG